MISRLLSAILLVVMLTLVACGGGGGSSPTPPPPPPTPTITVGPSALPGGYATQPYSATLTASGGTAPYTFSVGGTQPLPDGISLSSSGSISGTLGYDNGFSGAIEFDAKDANGYTGHTTLTLNLIGIYGVALAPIPQVGVLGYWQITVTGGVSPITWSTTGTLPPGLTLQSYIGDAEYALEGTPSTWGHFTFTVQATDSGSPARTVTASYAVDVEPSKLVLSPVIPAPATAGQPYSFALALTGGAGPYAWSLYGGALPAGLSINPATGLLSGTLTTPGYSSFTVRVTDSSVPDQQAQVVNYWLLTSANPLPPRNDTIATATPIFPGGYVASISPYGDSVGTSAPDQDYYVMTVPAGSKLAIDVDSYFALQPSNLDPVVEIVDANGDRFSSCNDPFVDNVPSGVPVVKTTTPNFTDPCMNHIDPTSASPDQNAYLEFMAPGSAGNVTLYIHVFDFRGDARPDMLYHLYVNTE